MKLNPPPAPSELPKAVARPSAGVAVKLIASPACPRLETRTADPLASVVRRLAQPAENAALVTSACPTATGAVVAETTVEGVRYVLVRCMPRPTEALLTLSPRERDIVDLITKGYPNKTIAELLDISAWTVGTHLRRIFAKLGVTSRAAMVARYLHHTEGR